MREPLQFNWWMREIKEFTNCSLPAESEEWLWESITQLSIPLYETCLQFLQSLCLGYENSLQISINYDTIQL